MRISIIKSILLISAMGLSANGFAAQIVSKSIEADLSKVDVAAKYWDDAGGETIPLLAQPMINPKPKTTQTSSLRIQSVNDGKWVAFRLKWKDKNRSEAGRLGEFSDAVAVQFPVKSNDQPPPIFMGAKDDPVHIFHWRAQYQRDKDKGKPEMKDLYPNMNVDIYPMEFADPGSLGQIPESMRETYSPGKASGNPQAYAKSGIDEIFAEGFGTSSVQMSAGSIGDSKWENGEWTVVITRPMSRNGGSVLVPGKGSFMGFAVWQGGEDEVGSRKSVTMAWTPILIEVKGK